MGRRKGHRVGKIPSEDDFEFVKNVKGKDGFEWGLYVSRKANEGRGGVLWRNIKLRVTIPRHGRGNFTIGWNGAGFSEGSETIYLKSRDPELLAQVREALEESNTREPEPLHG
jgi:hypothetical protein